MAARAFVEGLHSLGCKVALDDFGTGYGGFTYLKQLPIDFLKIDIEFVRDLRSSSASRHVVEAIVNLAGGFALKTVGEGVEDQETLDLLRELGVDYAQGFHIGRPAPLETGATEPQLRSRWTMSNRTSRAPDSRTSSTGSRRWLIWSRASRNANRPGPTWIRRA